MADGSPELGEVVGVRFEPRGPLAWFQAGRVSATAGGWVVGEHAGVAAVGQVVVGRGQCLAFPSEPGALPLLVREALAGEIPRPYDGAGRSLLDSLG